MRQIPFMYRFEVSHAPTPGLHNPAHPLFDSHVHLDADEFAADRADVLAASRAAGVMDLLIPATNTASWPRIAQLCAAESGLHPAYGLHPWYLDQHRPADLEALAAWLRTHPAVAIGECGLDFQLPRPDRDRQLQLLRGHLELAQRFGLPLVLHARRAFEQVILELQHFGKPLRGVVHSFSGSFEQAARLWELGFHVGIGGPITYPRAQRLRRIVACVPLDSLLLETDAPDQPGARHRGERNEPALLVEILYCVAQLRQSSPEAIADATTANARRLFLGA